MVPSYVFQAMVFFIAHFLTSNFRPSLSIMGIPKAAARMASWPAVKGGFQLNPGRLTWNIQITHLERKIIFQTPMIMFHVHLPECNPCPLNSVGFFFGSGIFWAKKT